MRAEIHGRQRRRHSLVADFVGAQAIHRRRRREARRSSSASPGEIVGWRSAPGSPAGRRYRSAGSWSFIQATTVCAETADHDADGNHHGDGRGEAPPPAPKSAAAKRPGCAKPAALRLQAFLPSSFAVMRRQKLTSAGMAKRRRNQQKCRPGSRKGLAGHAAARRGNAPDGEHQRDHQDRALCARAQYIRGGPSHGFDRRDLHASRAGEARKQRQRRRRSASASATEPASTQSARPAADVERFDGERHQLHRAAGHDSSQRQCQQRAGTARGTRFAKKRAQHIACGWRPVRARCRFPAAAAPRKRKSCCR